MTKMLAKAFDELSKLPESDQDALASLILEEIKSERRWAKLFAKSQDLLAQMGEEALQEDREGKTEELDPDTL